MKVVQRFLATGDLQVHQWKQFANLDKGMNSRLLNILSVFDFLLDYAHKEKIEQVFINGDIFEQTGAIDTLTFNKVYEKIEMFKDWGIHLVLNIGNHDVVGNDPEHPDTKLHSLVPFRRLACVVENSGWSSHVLVVPWDQPEALITKLSELKIEDWREAPHVLMTHCGVSGATSGPSQRVIRSQIKLQDLHPEKFHLILLSDFHSEQKLADHVFYMGSPIQHSFGEIHSPGVWDISLLDREPWFRAKKISTNLPRFVSVVVEKDSDLKKLAQWKGHYVRVVVSSDSIDVASLEAATSNIQARIEWRLPDIKTVEQETAILDHDELLAEWAGMKKASPKMLDLGKRLLG